MIRIASWNVNGLRAAISKGAETWFADSAADIICLQETKLQPGMDPTGASPFVSKFFHCADRRGYSGTAILSQVEPLTCQQPLNAYPHPSEGRVQVCEFHSFLVVNAYVPNAQNELKRLAYRREWNEAFRQLLVDLDSQKPVIACGDFNCSHQAIDLARPEANRQSAGFSDEEREDFSRLLESGFVDTFRQSHPGEPGHYTWWSYRGGARARNVGWRLDYILASKRIAGLVSNASIHANIMGSDHCPVTIDLNSPS